MMQTAVVEKTVSAMSRDQLFGVQAIEQRLIIVRASMLYDMGRMSVFKERLDELNAEIKNTTRTQGDSEVEK